MSELFLALSTVWVCVAALHAGLSTPAQYCCLLLLLSPLALQQGLVVLEVFILGSLWAGKTWERSICQTALCKRSDLAL